MSNRALTYLHGLYALHNIHEQTIHEEQNYISVASVQLDPIMFENEGSSLGREQNLKAANYVFRALH